MPRIVSLVEGKGESEHKAVPILIRRIAEDIGVYHIDCYRTIRIFRDTFPRFEAAREKALRAARIDAASEGAILIVIDSDGEPPCRARSHRSSPCLLGSALLDSVRPLTAGIPIAVVMAERMFESWFVAAAPSLVRNRGLREGELAPTAPDLIHNPKIWLSERMADPAQQYKPTTDQARFTEWLDMGMARGNSPSFDFAYQEIERLIRAIHGDPTQ